MQPMIPTTVEEGADPHVLAKQRAESIAFLLLGHDDYYRNLRAVVLRRAETEHREREAAWAAGGKQGPRPEPFGNTAVMRAIGHDAFRDAYNVAVGFGDADAEIELIVLGRKVAQEAPGA